MPAMFHYKRWHTYYIISCLILHQELQNNTFIHLFCKLMCQQSVSWIVTRKVSEISMKNDVTPHFKYEFIEVTNW